MDKKIVYLLLAATVHLLGPYLASQIIGNYINSLFSTDAEWLYGFLMVIFYILSCMLVVKSFHQTKPNVWSLYFVFGDPVGTLGDGTSYVPFGFMKDCVHTYTKAWINFNDIIHVVKLADIDKQVPQANLHGAKAFQYKMEIKLEGAFRIYNALNFFKATGLKEFTKESFDRKTDKFYSTVVADLSSNFDTISADRGFAQFKKKTDWTIEEILRESKRILLKEDDSLEEGEEDIDFLRKTSGETDSLEDTLEEYGLEFDKIATYTKFDAETEKVLAGQFQSEAQRGIDLYKAETQKKVKVINAETEVLVAQERAKAIKHLTEEICKIPEYKDKLTGSEIKEMVEASMDIWDIENLNKNIIDVKGLAELIPILGELLTKALTKKSA